MLRWQPFRDLRSLVSLRMPRTRALLNDLTRGIASSYQRLDLARGRIALPDCRRCGVSTSGVYRICAFCGEVYAFCSAHGGSRRALVHCWRHVRRNHSTGVRAT